MTDRMVASPARDRLERILNGLDGDPEWGRDADAVLAPALLAAIPVDAFRAR